MESEPDRLHFCLTEILCVADQRYMEENCAFRRISHYQVKKSIIILSNLMVEEAVAYTG